MPRGDKSAYTDKQKRKAEHIEEGYEKRGVSKKEAERRAWATVNRETGGGNKSGSGRGVQGHQGFVQARRSHRRPGRGAPPCSGEITLGEEGRRDTQATGRATRRRASSHLTHALRLLAERASAVLNRGLRLRMDAFRATECPGAVELSFGRCILASPRAWPLLEDRRRGCAANFRQRSGIALTNLTNDPRDGSAIDRDPRSPAPNPCTSENSVAALRGCSRTQPCDAGPPSRESSVVP